VKDERGSSLTAKLFQDRTVSGSCLQMNRAAVLTAAQERLAALQPTVAHDRRYLIGISLECE
jgi:hypothetical protein